MAKKKCLIFEVQQARMTRLRSDPPAYEISASGLVNTTGWTDIELVVRGFEADGMLDVDFVGTPPTGIVARVFTPVHASMKYDKDIDLVHGAFVEARTNKVVALPGADEQDIAPTTEIAGEEGPTTLAVGEETPPMAMAAPDHNLEPGINSAGDPTTLVPGAEGPGTVTTMALGEEGHPTTYVYGEEDGPTTKRLGEESPTTLAVGEEMPTTERVGEETPTTYVVGEEGGPTTFRVGEEGTPTTYRLGEEGPTTYLLGEEGNPTTYRIGEESGPTTYVVGEEGGPVTTHLLGEEGGTLPTTDLLGEEDPNKPYYGETDPRVDDPAAPHGGGVVGPVNPFGQR